LISNLFIVLYERNSKTKKRKLLNVLIWMGLKIFERNIWNVSTYHQDSLLVCVCACLRVCVRVSHLCVTVRVENIKISVLTMKMDYSHLLNQFIIILGIRIIRVQAWQDLPCLQVLFRSTHLYPAHIYVPFQSLCPSIFSSR
jgi:hypothetical protein